VTIPLSITVRLGEVATHPGAAIEVGAAVGALERIDPDPDYANRPGYDPDFLGFPVPLPRLTNTIRTLAARLDGAGEVELKYHHYSVVMNGERRLAFFAAGNFDAGAAVRHERDGNDRWFFDPRIGRDLQAGNEFYASNPLDRGHLFRRADGAWGATAEEAKLANDDTFHWANCSPQHEVFNQGSQATRRSLRLWGNLEDHIAAEAGEDNRRLNVFSGPVFRDHDRAHRGLRVPGEYWKIVVFANEDGQPRALAFLLSQAALISNLPRERFEVGEYDVFQVKVREVEHRTKLDFGELSGFDPLESPGMEERFEASSEAVPLRDLADMVL
jgi:endonuclease G, mitochondrial